MKNTIIIRVLVGFLLVLSALGAAEYDSSYTSIKAEKCRTISTHDLGSTQECASFEDIGVQVIDSDLRQSITLKRNGRLYPLDLYSRVSANWSMLGETIEWRYKKGDLAHPIAMICRFKVSEDFNKPEKMTSYLVVNKITRDTICAVGKIPPQANQNQIARDMADRARDMECL